MLPNDTLDQPQADTLNQTATAGDPSLTASSPVVNQQPASQQQAAPTTVQKWYDGLSDDLKNNPTVQKYKTAEDQVKAHLELTTLLGHTKVALPKDEKDELAIKQFNKAIGVPEEASGYKLNDFEPIEGLESLQFSTDEFKQVVHKHGLTPKQAQGIMNDYRELMVNIKQNAEKQAITNAEQARADLSKEWGMAFEGKVKLAQSVMNKFSGDKETFDYINSKIGSDATILKMFAKIGDNFREGTLGDLGTPRSFTKTPAEAKAEYDKIMTDPNDIYWTGVRNNQVIPESIRKERVSYVESLLKMQQGNA